MIPIEDIIEQNKSIYTMDEQTRKIKERFFNTEKLYHFTSSRSALDIIKSSSLKFSRMKKLNDINETYRPVYYDFTGNAKAKSDNQKLIEKEIRKYRQISFSQDIKNDPKCATKMAFTIEPMWGHYAERGYGACLVFDKSKLLENLGDDIWYREIEYSDAHDSSIDIHGNNPEEIREELSRNRIEYFFTKTKYWEYEQEFRLVKRCNGVKNEFLEFNDSLLAVIMYLAKNWPATEHCSGSQQYKDLQEALKDRPVFCYSSFRGARSLSYKDHKIFPTE